MKKRNVTLTIEQAQELYKLQPELRNTILSDFSDYELGINNLPTWSELTICSGSWIETNGIIKSVISDFKLLNSINVFATEKQAQSALAMAQLSQLMKALGDECEVDWENGNNNKYCIIRNSNNILYVTYIYSYQFLAFKTEKVRSMFYKKHKELIKQYFML